LQSDTLCHIASSNRQFSVRLSSSTFDALERRAHELAAPRNALTERYIDEGVKMDEHPGIYFRSGALGRRAALTGTRLDVWQVVDTVRSSGNSLTDAAEYLGLPLPKLAVAAGYYAAHRDEVDEIAERERTVAERAEATWRAGRELFA
jgi:uncharacterized protein (DUF433 family)